MLEGNGYSECKGYEDEVQALEDQARALEKISENVREALTQRRGNGSESAETSGQQNVSG